MKFPQNGGMEINLRFNSPKVILQSTYHVRNLASQSEFVLNNFIDFALFHVECNVIYIVYLFSRKKGIDSVQLGSKMISHLYAHS